MALKDLKEALLDVAQQMLEEAEDLKGTEDAASAYTRNTLKGYARQLKSLVKAAGEDAPVQSNPLPYLMPQTQHQMEVDKYRSEFRKNKEGMLSIPRDAATLEEDAEGEMVPIIGGPADPDDDGSTSYTINSSMPVDSRTLVMGHIYQLRKDDDGRKRLYYDAAQQEKHAPKIVLGK